MAAMRAMIVKEFRELVRDRPTMALLIVPPLVLLIVFGYAANFTVHNINVEVMGPAAARVAPHFAAPLGVSRVDPGATRADAVAALRKSKADVVVVTSDSGPPVALVDGSSLFTAQSAVPMLHQVPGLQVEVLFNPALKTSWWMVPALVGLIMTFIGTIVTSLGLVRERQAGTLEQLAVMPLSPADVIIGKIAPYFLLAAVNMVVVTALGALLFGVPFAGNVGMFAVGSALFLLVVLGLGVLISTVSQTQAQAIQSALILLLPQIVLSGMIFPLAAMPWGVRWIGYLLPLTYYIEISRGVMLRDAPLNALWLAMLVLVVMAVLVLGTAILRFRRDLAPNVKQAKHHAANRVTSTS